MSLKIQKNCFQKTVLGIVDASIWHSTVTVMLMFVMSFQDFVAIILSGYVRKRLQKVH